MRSSAAPAALLLVLGVAAPPAPAEPIFLSRQYSRCTNCHYSASGGGLLTPYGRSLSREELSTFGASRRAAAPGREQEFLFGALGDQAKPLSLGIDLRPSLRRGIWLRLSPQLLTAYGDATKGLFRVGAGLNILPRTHWNVVLSYYHDEDLEADASRQTLLAQLHLYL